MRNLLLIIIISICITLLLAAPVYAFNDGPSNLTIVMEYGDTRLPGIKVSICRVADLKEVSGTPTYVIVPAFSATGVDFSNLTKEKNLALATSLNSYALIQNIARQTETTDKIGRAVFSNLSAGLYLVAHQDGASSGYSIAPYLISVPYPVEGRIREWDYDVVIFPKTEPTKRNIDTISVNVFKIWAQAATHPESVQVQLYRNGSVHGDAVTLNAANYWSHKWEGLSAADTWTVDEASVPIGYTKIVSGNSLVGFIVTNTKNPDIPDPPPPDDHAPKTGDTRSWTAPILLGVAGLVVTIYVIRKSALRRNP